MNSSPSMSGTMVFIETVYHLPDLKRFKVVMVLLHECNVNCSLVNQVGVNMMEVFTGSMYIQHKDTYKTCLLII